ncbi:MAG: hypothetical protein NC420_03680 [Eubacterium sp.]|nr:hypothetical protein [Eubacterium sp.]
MYDKERINALIDRIIGTDINSKGLSAMVNSMPEHSHTMTEQIKDWIRKLESGDLTGLKAAYSAFSTEDAVLIRHAGEAVTVQLKGLTRQQLLKVCGQFRGFTSLEWTIDWAGVSLERIKKELPEESYRYVLLLGSFHPNGYFREKCLYEMAGYQGMLFWMFFRVNDWVRNVRDAACEILEEYLQNVSAEELVDSMPAFEHLRDCRRRTEIQMGRLCDRVEARMTSALKEIDANRILGKEPAVRKVLYSALMRGGIFTLQEADTILKREKISCLKRILVRGILGMPDCTLDRAEDYLTDSSAVVRRMAVEYKYERLKTCWPGLEKMLTDSSRGIREYAVYILERHGSMDIRAYYLRHLEDDRPEYAILGLGEHSSRGNVPALMKCLERPERKTVKCTILALGHQEDFTKEELFWRYLLDDRNDISKAAYLSIRRKDFYPGAERLYHACVNAQEEHQRRYLLNLLLRESSWSRLPWLVRLYRRDMPAEEDYRILSAIRSRFAYGRLSETLQADILLALEENGRELPEGMEAAIMFDMRFV